MLMSVNQIVMFRTHSIQILSTISLIVLFLQSLMFKFPVAKKKLRLVDIHRRTDEK